MYIESLGQNYHDTIYSTIIPRIFTEFNTSTLLKHEKISDSSIYANHFLCCNHCNRRLATANRSRVKICGMARKFMARARSVVDRVKMALSSSLNTRQNLVTVTAAYAYVSGPRNFGDAGVPHSWNGGRRLPLGTHLSPGVNLIALVKPELSVGCVDPWVGLGWVGNGSKICVISGLGWVGSWV